MNKVVLGSTDDQPFTDVTFLITLRPVGDLRRDEAPHVSKSQKCIPLVNLLISLVAEQVWGGRGWLTE